MPEPRTIGFVSPLLGGQFYGGLLRGVQLVAQQQGLQLVAIQTLGEHERERQIMVAQGSRPTEPSARQAWHFSALNETAIPPAGLGRIDGWLLVTIDHLPPAYVEALLRAGAPAVLLCGMRQGLPAVMADNYGGSYAATQHLIGHGHREIAFVGWPGQEDIRQRHAGFLAALSDHGIAPEPRLLVEAEDNLESGGRSAARQLLAAHVPFSAVVAATDFNALGVMALLQEAGRRVPDEVAVTGFDDLDPAQRARPPLTTVRQSFEQIGGAGARLLVEMLAGATVEPGPHLTSTALVERLSCGCHSAADDLLEGIAQPGLEQAWRRTLSQQLVELLLRPTKPPPGAEPAQIWPGVERVVEGLAAAIEGGEPPGATAQAWVEVVALTGDLAVDQALVDLLADTGERLLVEQPRDPAAGERPKHYRRQMRLELGRARASVEGDRSSYLSTVIQHSYDLSLLLLEVDTGAACTLEWMARTSFRWGALGLWSLGDDGALELSVAGSYSRDGLTLPPPGLRCSPGLFPPAGYLPPPSAMGDEVLRLVPIRSLHHDWGVLALCGPIERTFAVGHDHVTQTATLLAGALEREMLLEALSEREAQPETGARAPEGEGALEWRPGYLKTAFLANMSHELRTPLNAIINFTRFLGDPDISGGTLNEQQVLFRQRVLVNADHLLGLLNDLIDLAKADAGKLELKLESAEIAPLLKGVMGTAIGLTRDQRLGLELELPDEELPRVSIDKVRVRQVLLSLLFNAARFTEQGGITVRAVETASRGSAADSESGRYVLISVQDTGSGIPPERQSQIFEEFYDLDDDLAVLHRGTGLGLPLVRRFVEMHGGSLWLESEVGRGSTFYLTLPVAGEA